MKRLLIIFMGVMLLVGCGNEKKEEPVIEKETEPEEQEETKVVFDRKNDAVLIDNEDLEVKLTQSRHERAEGCCDYMKLMFVIKNKNNKTHEFYFDEIKLDKNVNEFESLTQTDSKVKPNEEVEVIVIVDSLDEMEFDEYIGGRFVYIDYEKNVNEIDFSEYIIEQ